MELYLGIDGGGTKTSVWLADGDGKVLGRSEAGPSNPHKVGLASAIREIAKAFRLCLPTSGVRSEFQKGSRSRLHSVCAGIAGSDRKSIHSRLLAWMRKNIPARHHILTSDATIALSAAFQDSPGIIIISGTGSIAFGRDSEGNLLRAGGWGIPFDDCGSGYEIGRAAVAAALRSHDGRSPRTKLTTLMCHKFGLKSIDEIVGLRLKQQEIAAIFPLAVKAASEGDPIARAICDSAAEDLAAIAAALIKKMALKQTKPRIAMSGGVFESSPMIRKAFKRSIQAQVRDVQVGILKRAPVEGAIWMARNSGRNKARASMD